MFEFKMKSKQQTIKIFVMILVINAGLVYFSLLSPVSNCPKNIRVEKLDDAQKHSREDTLLNSMYRNFTELLGYTLRTKDQLGVSDVVPKYTAPVNDIHFNTNLVTKTVETFTSRGKPLSQLENQRSFNIPKPVPLVAASRHFIANTEKNLFMNYSLQDPPKTRLLEDTRQYFTSIGNLTCLIEGTFIEKTKQFPSTCNCKQRWYGPWCSFPTVLQNSNMLPDVNISIRESPRRVMMAISFNKEYEWLEARFDELEDVVDLFLITESDFTGYGERKPLYLFKELQKGFLSEYHHKIVHIYVDSFPENGFKDGWIADKYPRDKLGEGMAKQVLGKRHDDLFLFFDADEIPNRESVLFLKLHDGYTEPFGWNLKKSTYGFFWTENGGEWNMNGGSTVGFLGHVYENKASKLRDPNTELLKASFNVMAYVKGGGKVRNWMFGHNQFFAGWHCSWCFPPEGIKLKLNSAINADFPRWGDYPEKKDLSYIRSLIGRGLWFDDVRRMEPVEPGKDHAPPYILKNFHRFRYLLINPYTDIRQKT